MRYKMAYVEIVLSYKSCCHLTIIVGAVCKSVLLVNCTQNGSPPGDSEHLSIDSVRCDPGSNSTGFSQPIAVLFCQEDIW